VLLVGVNCEQTRLKLLTYAWKGRSQTILAAAAAVL
jgi:hypothetical protein